MFRLLTPLPGTEERYCRRCSYPLRGLPEQRCPECGQAFDPGDPKTYTRTSAQRRRARRLVIGVATVVALGALGFVAFRGTQAQWREVQHVRMCAECGAVSESLVVEICGLPVWRRESGEVSTPVSRFLSAHVGDHSHEWRPCFTTTRDWHGKEILRSGTPGRILLSSLCSGCTEQSLRALSEAFPDLAPQIQRDILRQRDPHLSQVCAWHLTEMCQARNEALARRNYRLWQLYKAIAGNERTEESDEEGDGE